MKKTITILFLFLWLLFLFSTIQYNIDSLKSVLTIAKEDSNKVKTLNRLSIALAWSIPDTGIIYAEESILLSKKIKYEPGESAAYTVMGNCLTTLGNYPLALDYFYKSLEYEEKTNSRLGQRYVYGGLSIAYRDMGEYQKSLDYIRKSLSLENPGVVNPLCWEIFHLYMQK
jgi:tetratricopeptide (TPR) repeat protein